MTPKPTRNDLLVVATQNAVTLRRNELNKRKLELIKFTGNMAHGLSEDEKWKSYSQICSHEIIELAAIEKELSIIENLMIKTQKEFQKLGGQIRIEIRRSDISDETYKKMPVIEKN